MLLVPVRRGFYAVYRIYRFTRYSDQTLKSVGVNVNSSHVNDHDNGDKDDCDRVSGRDDGDRYTSPLLKISEQDSRKRRPATALGLTRSERVPGAADGGCGGGNGCRPGTQRAISTASEDRADAGMYPNSLQSWRPPLLFQYCKVSGEGGKGRDK